MFHWPGRPRILSLIQWDLTQHPVQWIGAHWAPPAHRRRCWCWLISAVPRLPGTHFSQFKKERQKLPVCAPAFWPSAPLGKFLRCSTYQWLFLRTASVGLNLSPGRMTCCLQGQLWFQGFKCSAQQSRGKKQHQRQSWCICRGSSCTDDMSAPRHQGAASPSLWSLQGRSRNTQFLELTLPWMCPVSRGHVRIRVMS